MNIHTLKQYINMESSKSIIIEKAAKIINNSGLEALTIPNLELKGRYHNNQLTKDDDIILILLGSFEDDLKTIVHEIANDGIVPEISLKLFFKRLYSLFQTKSYYLHVIFDKSLFKRDDKVKISIINIKNIAEKYLATIIEAGKINNSFKANLPTRLLVKKILSEFRSMIENEHMVNEMKLEFNKIKKYNNDEQ